MIRGFLLTMAAFLAGTGARAADDPLGAHRWAHRVVVISAPATDDSRLLAQRAALAALPDALRARDLVVLEAVGAEAPARRLRESLKVPPDTFRVVLVGKDGEAKRIAAEPLPVEALFSTIDAMPMRRDEAKRRGEIGR